MDAERFTRWCAQAPTREQAVALDRGPFLMGFTLSARPEYEFWITETQSRYESLYLKTLVELVRIKREQRAYAAAIHYAQQYLAVDALAEEIHRTLITRYAEKRTPTHVPQLKPAWPCCQAWTAAFLASIHLVAATPQLLSQRDTIGREYK